MLKYLFLFLSVTGMSPLSPYLNLDPRYLVQVRRWLVFIVLNSIPLFVWSYATTSKILQCCAVCNEVLN